MKILKTTIYSVALAAMMASCGTTAPIIATPIQNVNTVSLKKTPLTEEQLKTWGMMDLVRDTVPGMSVDRAYTELLKNRKGEMVIVGIIDSGVDIDHEDLKNVMWVNPGEIAGNGKDDDGNGYIDDIHGWNFLGNMLEDNMEYVRIVRALSPKYKGKPESAISAADRDEYALYQKANAEFEKEYGETNLKLERYEELLANLKPVHEHMTARLGKEDYSLEDLQNIENPTAEEQQQIAILGQFLSRESSVAEVIKQVQGGIDYFSTSLASHYNMTKDFRGILGDDPNDITDNIYGDGNVTGPEEDRAGAQHGTHVAGIVGAQRNNGIGMNGVANNVWLMAVRAVPDGDEYDKDIALAIRYAVDNGAKVLNTSFGKYYSPHSQWVIDAIKYAAEKDVLIVNAAGNDGHDLDTINVYPNDQFDNSAEFSDTFITVGALNYEYGENMIANFSNYGKINVDVFAPGVKIWATTPLSTYEFLNGTSMAAPNVAGVAAVIRSYYPNLSAAQVKDVILNSGLAIEREVILGGDESNRTSFKNASKSGRMVNLYNALIMADKLSRK